MRLVQTVTPLKVRPFFFGSGHRARPAGDGKALSFAEDLSHQHDARGPKRINPTRHPINYSYQNEIIA